MPSPYIGVKLIQDIHMKMKATGPRKWQKEPKLSTNWFFKKILSINVAYIHRQEVLFSSLDTFETYQRIKTCFRQVFSSSKLQIKLLEMVHVRIFQKKIFDFEVTILPARVHKNRRLHIQTLIIFIASSSWHKITPYRAISGYPAVKKNSEGVLLWCHNEN